MDFLFLELSAYGHNIDGLGLLFEEKNDFLLLVSDRFSDIALPHFSKVLSELHGPSEVRARVHVFQRGQEIVLRAPVRGVEVDGGAVLR